MLLLETYTFPKGQRKEQVTLKNPSLSANRWDLILGTPPSDSTTEHFFRKMYSQQTF